MGVRLLDKIKIYELAKKLDITSKDLVNKAKELGMEVSSHLSSISVEQAEKLEKSVKGSGNTSNKQAKEEKSKAKEENKKGSTPVIIRREVIISDDEDRRREDEKKKENSRKDVGFVERKSNQDYNIVYRNKPQKPLTVSELFGLSKKEEKKEEPPKKEETKNEVKVEETNTISTQKEASKEDTKTISTTNVETKNTTEVKENKIQVNSQNNNYKNAQTTNNYRNNQRDNNFHNNNNYHGNQNGNYRNNSNNYRDNNGQNRFNNRNNQNGQNKYNNQRPNFNRPQRPLDSKGIDRNIKDIMSTEIMEKENQRDYNNRAIDKAKSNRYEEKNKKTSRSRKGDFDEFDSGKLNKLKQEDRLSHMFTEQDGGMLDYYDLTTARGKRNKKTNSRRD